MLATFPPSSSPHQYLPAVPSPLSPRSANIYGRHPSRHMSEPQKTSKIFSAYATDSPTPFSKRSVKKAPSPSQTELKERRRTNFLRKVRDTRDDKRFEARNEDVMRLDFMQRKQAYEAELARSAPSEPIIEEEEEEPEYELPGWSQTGSQMQISSQVEADEYEREAEGELMALLEYMPEQMDTREKEESLWSDDADYDALFSEVMGQENDAPRCDGVENVDVQQQDGEEMDMS